MGGTRLPPGKDFDIPDGDGLVRLGCGWNKGANFEQDIDMACLILQTDGQVKEVVYHGFRANRKNTIKHIIDDPKGGGAPNLEDEVIELNLAKQPEDTKAMIFTLHSGPLGNLSVPEEIFFKLKNEEGVTYAECNLPPTMRKPEVKSVIGAGLFRDGAGWTFRFFLKPIQKFGSWGEIIPQVKESMKFNIEDIEIDENEFVTVVRDCEDRSLEELYCLRRVEAEKPAEQKKALLPEEELEQQKAAEEAAKAEAEAEDEGPQGPPPLTNLRIDIGWLVKAKYEEKEVEMDVTLVLFNEVGEEVGQVASGDETEGVKSLGVEEPEEEEEEEDEDEDEDDEDAPKKKKKKPEKVFPPEATWFPLKERIAVNLKEISPEVRSIVCFVSKYDEENEKGTFFKVESVRARFVATFEEPEQEEEEEEDEDEDEDAPKKPKKEKTPDHVLSLISVDTKQPASKMQTSVVLFKLYRDFQGSEYHKWRADPAVQPDLETMKKQMSIGPLGMIPPADEDEEEVEETPDQWYARLGLDWRHRGIGLFHKDEGPEDLVTTQLNAVATYDGKRDAEGKRHDRFSRSIYPNGDVYWGEYRETYRNGDGFYLFKGGSTFCGSLEDGAFKLGTLRHPDGSVYVGEHKGCLQEGEGEYTYASGERYTGGWKEGKKHGKGVYYYNDGSVLHGEWENGTMHGEIKWEHNVAFITKGSYEQGVPAQRWVWENKKTHLKQAGHYVTLPPAEDDEEEEFDEEEGPPKPQPPEWKRLSWNPDGMTYEHEPPEPPPEEIAAAVAAAQAAQPAAT